MKVYALTEKSGFNPYIFDTWDKLYVKYISFCNSNNLPIVNSSLLFDIVENSYYEIKKNKLHYFIIKTETDNKIKL